jgi:hypothetical protein
MKRREEKSQRELENTFVNTCICHLNRIRSSFPCMIFCVIWISVCVLSYAVNVCVSAFGGSLCDFR